MLQYVIYGTGGHARVVADALSLLDKSLIGYFDDQVDHHQFKQIPLNQYNESINQDSYLVIGIGNNEIRRDIAKYVVHDFGTIIHPNATVAADVIIGEGTVVLAGAVIQTGAVIGKHCVINANVTIDHDAVVGDFCSIYPNSYVGGAANIGAGVMLEAGSIVKRSAIVPAAFECDDVLQIGMY